MKFQTVEHRRLTIKEADKRDLKEYKRQLNYCSMEEKDKIEIAENLSDEGTSYLAIFKEDKKMIGLIKVSEKSKISVEVEISIPNEAWCLRYGTDAIHQFVKECKRERILFVKLKEENLIVKMYKMQRPEVFFNENTINFAFVN